MHIFSLGHIKNGGRLAGGGSMKKEESTSRSSLFILLLISYVPCTGNTAAVLDVTKPLKNNWSKIR
jgi:hypothetical protein